MEGTICSYECFSVLHHASTNFQLKIKEAIHIQWEQPTLNHQLYHVNLKFPCKCLHYCVTWCKSKLKMTEELSKHVFEKCFTF